MATNTSNNTHIKTSYKVWMPLPTSQCIPWVAVFITECLAMVILNIITIIVFVKQRQLQRRSTYLIIHLAIVDLLAGAVSGPLKIEFIMGTKLCNLWDYNWDVYSVKRILRVFPASSLINLAVISLERVHATFYPFRHRFIKKWVYGVIIAVIWIMTAGIVVVVVAVSQPIISLSMISYFLSLFVICVSYVCVIIKVRCHRRPQHHGATGQRERKLTSTLLRVTLASLITWLPFVIYDSLFFLVIKLSAQSFFNLTMIVQVLYYASSLINPIIYALQMPELRAGVSQLFQRNPN